VSDGLQQLTDFKMSQLTAAIEKIDSSLIRLENTQMSLVSTMGNLAVQVQGLVELKKIVDQHEREIILLGSRMKHTENSVSTIPDMTHKINRHTWVDRLGIWVSGTIVTGLMGLILWVITK
jgi:hypothetical protein